MKHVLKDKRTNKVLKRSKYIGVLFEVQDQMLADHKADSYSDFIIEIERD